MTGTLFCCFIADVSADDPNATRFKLPLGHPSSTETDGDPTYSQSVSANIVGHLCSNIVRLSVRGLPQAIPGKTKSVETST